MRIFKKLTCIVFILLFVFSFISCNNDVEIKDKDLWSSAKYKEDTSIGVGDKTIELDITAADKTITLTVSTSKTTLCDAMLEFGLVSGEFSQYGYFVNTVNNIPEKTNKDSDMYWLIFIKDKLSETSIDKINIKNGDKYTFKYDNSYS